MMISTKILGLAFAVSISVGPVLADDAPASGDSLPPGMPSSYTPGSTVSTGTYGQNLLPEGNPLSGLFTPQPQFPTAQTQMNQSDPSIPGQFSGNPLGGLFTYQNPSPDPNKPAGQTNNMLQGLFTGQSPFPTAQTPTNPQPQAKYAVEGFGQPSLDALKKDHIPFKVDDPNAPKDPNDYPGRLPDPKPADAAVADKKDGKDKDAKTADKNDKDAKDKDGKDKDTKTADKDKDAKTADKDKDAKAGDKAKDATTADKDKDGKTADADAKPGESKDKDKEQAAAKPSGPYNALKDALVLLNAGQGQQAVQVLAPFLKEHPTNAEAHYIAAVAFVMLRDMNMAAAEYRVVLHLVPATQLASLAVEGLKKIGMPAVTKQDNPAAQLPPLRQGNR